MCFVERDFRESDGRAPILSALCLCLWFAFGCPSAIAIGPVRSLSQYAHRSWGERDGTPTMPMALAQTSDGYLWAGGATGLFRFDGVRFELFEPASKTKLPRKAIIHLLALPDGKLWVGFSMGGLSLIDNGNVTNYTEADGLPPNELMEPVQDRDGQIWVSTTNGLARFDGKRWERIGDSWNCPQTSADGIFVDSRGTIWVGIDRTILFLRRGSHHFERTGDFAAQAYQFAEAPDGKVWVADTEHGVRPVGSLGTKRETIAKCMAIAARKGLNTDGCGSDADLEIKASSAGLLFDHDGGLWMTTLGHGLLRISEPAKLVTHRIDDKDKAVEKITAKEGMTSDYSVPILEDREGNIWVGTRDGMDQFRQTPLVPVTFPSGSRDFSLTPGNDGYMWIVATKSHLVRTRGAPVPSDINTVESFSASYPTKEVRYFRTTVGIYELIDGRVRKVAKNPNNLIGEVEMVLTQDNKGKLWAMVQAEGLFFLQGNRWIRYSTPPEISKLRPVTAYTDRMGSMWFGFAENRLVQFANSKMAIFGPDDGMLAGPVKAVFGHDQHFWIGGSRGLVLLAGGKFRTILSADSEPKFHNVSGVVESDSYGLWLTSTGGVVHISNVEVQKTLADSSYHPRKSCSIRRMECWGWDSFRPRSQRRRREMMEEFGSRPQGVFPG